MEIDPFIRAGTTLFEDTSADAVLVEVDSIKDMEKLQGFISSKAINLFGVSSNEKIKKKFDNIIFVPGILKKITTRLEFAISAALMQDLLKNEGKIIVEIEKKNTCPETSGLTLLKDRVHGIKRIGIYKK